MKMNRYFSEYYEYFFKMECLTALAGNIPNLLTKLFTAAFFANIYSSWEWDILHIAGLILFLIAMGCACLLLLYALFSGAIPLIVFGDSIPDDVREEKRHWIVFGIQTVGLLIIGFATFGFTLYLSLKGSSVAFAIFLFFLVPYGIAVILERRTDTKTTKGV